MLDATEAARAGTIPVEILEPTDDAVKSRIMRHRVAVRKAKAMVRDFRNNFKMKATQPTYMAIKENANDH